MRLLTALIALLPSIGYPETHDVKMLTRGDTGAMIYEPAHLKIAPGDTVRFLATQRGHNAVSIPEMLPEGAERFIGKIDEQISVSFEIEGRYGIKCSPHYAMGMMKRCCRMQCRDVRGNGYRRFLADDWRMIPRNRFSVDEADPRS